MSGLKNCWFVIKPLFFSKTGRMCIGGSGLCMEGEQRKNQSPARRAGSAVSGSVILILTGVSGEIRGQEV